MNNLKKVILYELIKQIHAWCVFLLKSQFYAVIQFSMHRFSNYFWFQLCHPYL